MPPSAEDAQDADVFARHKFGGHGGSGSGSDLSQVGGGHAECGMAGGGIKNEVGGVKLLVRISGSIDDHNELHAQAMAFAVVARHHEEDAFRQLHLRAHGHDGGGVTVAESIFDRGNHSCGFECGFDVVLGEVSQMVRAKAQGLKPAMYCRLYAALERRSSTTLPLRTPLLRCADKDSA